MWGCPSVQGMVGGTQRPEDGGKVVAGVPPWEGTPCCPSVLGAGVRVPSPLPHQRLEMCDTWQHCPSPGPCQAPCPGSHSPWVPQLALSTVRSGTSLPPLSLNPCRCTQAGAPACSAGWLRLVPPQPDPPGGRACARGHLAAAALVEGALLSPPLEDRAHWTGGLGSRTSPCFPEPEVSHCCCLFISSCKCAPCFGE